MEFWGVEVKPGEIVKCGPGGDKYLHLSQASLGETKSKGNENVAVFVKFDHQKLVLGTLSAEKFPQIPYDLVFEKEFELSHTSKNVSVYFCGYKSVAPDEHSEEDYPETESEEEDAQIGQHANGKPAVKQDQAKSGHEKANNVKEDNSATKKAIKIEPTKDDKPKAGDADDEDDDDDEDDIEEDSEDDEDMLGAMSDSDDEDEDESSEEEDEATPKKAVTGKRPAESTSKGLARGAEKKAKVITPAAGHKTGGDGKKVVHVATPYPAKQAGKAAANNDKSKQQTPKSAGSVPCKSCTRTFNSESALQAHTKAKHGGT